MKWSYRNKLVPPPSISGGSDCHCDTVLIAYRKLNVNFNSYSGIFYFCQYLHIGAGILSFGGDVFRL